MSRIVLLASIAVSVSMSYIYSLLSLAGQVLLVVSALWSLVNLVLLHSVPEFQRNERGMLARTKKMMFVLLVSFIFIFPLLCTTSNLLGLSPFVDNAARTHQPTMIEFVKAPPTLSADISPGGALGPPSTRLAAANEGGPARTDEDEDRTDVGNSRAAAVEGDVPSVPEAASPVSTEAQIVDDDGAARSENAPIVEVAADQGAAPDSAISTPEQLDSSTEAPPAFSHEEASSKLEDTRPDDNAGAMQQTPPEGGFAEAGIHQAADGAATSQESVPGFASVLPATERQDEPTSAHLVDELAPPEGGFIEAGIGPRSAEAGIVGGARLAAGPRAAEPNALGSDAAAASEVAIERAPAHETPLARLERQRREVIAGIKRQLMRGNKRGATNARPADAAVAAGSAPRDRLRSVADRAAKGAARASVFGVPVAVAAKVSTDKVSNALRAARRTRRTQQPNARAETPLAAAAPMAPRDSQTRDGDQPASDQVPLMSDPDSKGDADPNAVPDSASPQSRSLRDRIKL